MDAILQGLMELSGVRATMVLDGTGHIVAHRGHAVYDRGVCEGVGATVMKAIESIQLQQDDWETITAQFADGRILLRRITALTAGPKHVIAVVADASLNASFATVALRVAANKVRGALEGGASHAGSSQLTGTSSVHGPAGSSPGLPSDSRPNLSSSGVSWSKGSNVGSSGTGLSNVSVADPAAAAFLGRCVKELASHVGPMSKVYVQEAVRRISPDAPFSLALVRQLVDELGGQIEDPKDRAQFRKAVLEKK